MSEGAEIDDDNISRARMDNDVADAINRFALANNVCTA